MKKHIIYRIINLINRKIYIGKTSMLLRKRWATHKAHGKYWERYFPNKKPTYLYRAMGKYGVQNFEIRQIDEAKNYNHNKFLESFYIKYYNSHDPKYGYNLVIDGEKYGDGLEFISEETLGKQSLSRHLSLGASGVNWDNFRKKWLVGFYKGKRKVRKRFNSKEEAQIAKDKMNIFLYKDKAQLFYPEKRAEYESENLEDFWENICVKKEIAAKYQGVRPDNNGFVVRLISSANKRVYLGFYENEEDAAKIYDKAAYYIKGSSGKFNFPELVNHSYYEEGKSIYEKYTDPKRQMDIKGGKDSKYNGVSKRGGKTWEMSLVINKKRIRESYYNEEDAAKAHDFQRLRLKTSENKLNFPELKPVFLDLISNGITTLFDEAKFQEQKTESTKRGSRSSLKIDTLSDQTKH